MYSHIPYSKVHPFFTRVSLDDDLWGPVPPPAERDSSRRWLGWIAYVVIYFIHLSQWHCLGKYRGVVPIAFLSVFYSDTICNVSVFRHLSSFFVIVHCYVELDSERAIWHSAVVVIIIIIRIIIPNISNV